MIIAYHKDSLGEENCNGYLNKCENILFKKKNKSAFIPDFKKQIFVKIRLEIS